MNEENINAIINESGTGLKIGVIGIGNAGSQVALAAAKRGIQVFIMNTSIKDLDDSVVGKSIKAHQIGDGRGSGKDRDNAMALLKSNGAGGIKEIFDNPYFRQTVMPADIVFVTFSTAGGTGSGCLAGVAPRPLCSAEEQTGADGGAGSGDDAFG